MTRFVVQNRVGKGGFGEVWSCVRDTDLKEFAIKRLVRTSEEDSLARFVREVRILSKLDHPNIVKVIASQTDESYWFVMPMYRGSLRGQIQGPLEPSRIRVIFTAILDGMEYAHSQGVIHRDLKPENILMNSDEDIVISDFGLGRIMDTESLRQTHTGFKMGTPYYVPPEQSNNAKLADARSDVYSLGRILYELYTGPINSVKQVTSGLPSGIALLIDRCTDDNPDNRFQTVAELKQVWLAIFDAEQHKNELRELMLLRAELTRPALLDTGKVARLMEILVGHAGDGDVLHETLMQLDPGIVVEMYEQNPALVRGFIERFVSFAKQQTWPFDYTDRIGNRCRELFRLILDAEIRAALIFCAWEVGVSHNRWHVLRLFSDMIHQANDAALLLALRTRYRSVSSEAKGFAREHLDISGLNQNLVKLLATGNSSSTAV